MADLETFYYVGRICSLCGEEIWAGGRHEHIYCKEGCPNHGKSNED